MRNILVSISLLLFSSLAFSGATLNCEAVAPEFEYVCDLLIFDGSQVSNVNWFPGGGFSEIYEEDLTAAFRCLGNNAGIANVTYIIDGSSGGASQQLPCSGGGNDGSSNGNPPPPDCDSSGSTGFGSPTPCERH